MRRSLKSLLLGSALRNEQLSHERLSRLWGLPIMASDAVSSVAYAVEEILMALVPIMGLMAVQWVGLVSIPIILLLLILIFSYTQIINHYPNGGGSYVVAKESFGRKPSLLAAACLVVDYVMTVAVSTSSATAAIVAAFPAIHAYRVLISLVCIFLITLVNMRGLSESSKIFGTPTYAFILTMGILIVTGIFRVVTGTLEPIAYTDAQIRSVMTGEAMSGITLLLFLKAFSSGCSALTGVEAVSNAIPNFREPSQKTAKHVLFLLGAVIVCIFGGISFLAGELKVINQADVTVMSQIANAVFGQGFMFYVVQFTTALILLLAANTAYNGLPILLSLLAKDRYMPRQFGHRGARLSFSNGIAAIFVVCSLLLIIFQADTHRLIPFYAVGVFVSFTFSQAGMFVKWLKSKEKGWQYKSLINGFGAIITLVGTIVVFWNKFSDGAWFLLVIIPVMVIFMMATHKHYANFAKEIGVEGYDYQFKDSVSNANVPCVVLIHSMSRAALKTLDYGLSLSHNVTALHISTTPRHTELLRKQWAEMKVGLPLTVVETPYRSIMEPLTEYVSAREKELVKGENLTVVLTKFVGNHLRDRVFHNQTTFFIENMLSQHKNVVTVIVPYLYKA